MKKRVITVVYGIGVIAVVALVCMFISHSTYVSFPDTMIPTTLYELATEWLALGALPMLITCFLMKNTYEAKGRDAALMRTSVATGSACNSKDSELSHVIEAIRVPKDYANGTIRITLGVENTEEQMFIVAGQIRKIIGE